MVLGASLDFTGVTGDVAGTTQRAAHFTIVLHQSTGDAVTNGTGLAVVATAERIGVREGRRIKGRYEITMEDVLTGATHKDSIARSRYPVDIHAINSKKGKSYYGAPGGKKAKPYDIPLRALIAADVDGLMMAGRCISGDFIAHASYRVTGNSVPMGEMAGRCSAVSISQGVMPHEVAFKDLINS